MSNLNDDVKKPGFKTAPANILQNEFQHTTFNLLWGIRNIYPYTQVQA